MTHFDLVGSLLCGPANASLMVHRHAKNETRVLVKPELDLNGWQMGVAVGH